MSLHFDRYKFLEFFDIESNYNENQYATYLINHKNYMIFTLIINQQHEIVTIKLEDKNLLIPIFNIDLSKIIKLDIRIDRNNKVLQFYRSDNEHFLFKDEKIRSPFLKLMFYPNVAFQYEL